MFATVASTVGHAFGAKSKKKEIRGSKSAFWVSNSSIPSENVEKEKAIKKSRDEKTRQRR
jgi:hypothetical protein